MNPTAKNRWEYAAQILNLLLLTGEKFDGHSLRVHLKVERDFQMELGKKMPEEKLIEAQEVPNV